MELWPLTDPFFRSQVIHHQIRNRRTRRKTCPRVDLHPTNPTRTVPGTNPGFQVWTRRLGVCAEPDLANRTDACRRSVWRTAIVLIKLTHPGTRRNASRGETRTAQIWPFYYFWSQTVKHAEFFLLAVRPLFVSVACSLCTETILQVQSVLLSRDNSVVKESCSKNNWWTVRVLTYTLCCVSQPVGPTAMCTAALCQKRTRVIKTLFHNNSTSLYLSKQRNGKTEFPLTARPQQTRTTSLHFSLFITARRFMYLYAVTGWSSEMLVDKLKNLLTF
jgi:hypothetical protein